MAFFHNHRRGQLRAQGGYSDIYYDYYGEYVEFLGLFAHKAWPFSTDYVKVSGIFLYQAESEEHPDIWDAIRTTWNNRNSYATMEDLRVAMNDALEADGYTAPDGGPIL